MYVLRDFLVSTSIQFVILYLFWHRTCYSTSFLLYSSFPALYIFIASNEELLVRFRGWLGSLKVILNLLNVFQSFTSSLPVKKQSRIVLKITCSENFSIFSKENIRDGVQYSKSQMLSACNCIKFALHFQFSYF